MTDLVLFHCGSCESVYDYLLKVVILNPEGPQGINKDCGKCVEGTQESVLSLNRALLHQPFPAPQCKASPQNNQKYVWWLRHGSRGEQKSAPDRSALSAWAVDALPPALPPAFCDQMSKPQTCEHMWTHDSHSHLKEPLPAQGGQLPWVRWRDIPGCRLWKEARGRWLQCRDWTVVLPGTCKPTFLSISFPQHL